VLCSTLSDTAEQCGPPGCGGSVITGQGEAYFTTVVTPTNPVGKTGQIEYCSADGRRTSEKKTRHSELLDQLTSSDTTTEHMTGSPRAPAPAPVVVAAPAYRVDVIVYSGPVTLASKTHGSRTHGWVQVTLVFSSLLRTPAQLALDEAQAKATFPRLDATMTTQLNKYFFSFDKPRIEY